MLSIEINFDYLFLEVQKCFFDDVVALHSSGIASILLFKRDSKATC